MENEFIFVYLSHVFIDCPIKLSEVEEKYYCDEVLIASGLQDIDDVCEIVGYTLFRFNCVVEYRIGLFVSPRFINATDAKDSIISSLQYTILSGSFGPFKNNTTEIFVGDEALSAALTISSAIPSSNRIPLESNYIDSLIALIVIIGFAALTIIIIGYFIFAKFEERKATKRTWNEWLQSHGQSQRRQTG